MSLSYTPKAMTALDDRSIAAIRQRLNPLSDQPGPGYRQGEPQQLFRCKSDEAKVLQLKQDGNGHFRKKQFLAATHKYTQVRVLNCLKQSQLSCHLLCRQSWKHLGLSTKDKRL